jgi:transcriptional regulator with XRE-family HTH domain
MSVSENYTPKFSEAKLQYGNMAGLAYALPMGFPQRLRQARKAEGLSGEELGRQLAVGKATISHWENARYEPSIAQLGALCDVLKVTADWLMDREHRELSAEAVREARAYESLAPEDRRKWRALRTTMFSTT